LLDDFFAENRRFRERIGSIEKLTENVLILAQILM